MVSLASSTARILTSHCTVLDRERRNGEHRAAVVDAGRRGKDGPGKNALLAPGAFTTAEKRRQTVRTPVAIRGDLGVDPCGRPPRSTRTA